MPHWTELLLGSLALVALFYAARSFLASDITSPKPRSSSHENTCQSPSFAVIIPTLSESAVLASTISCLFSNAAKQRSNGNPASSITVIVVDASHDVSPTRRSLEPLLATYQDSLHLVKYSGSPSRGLQMNFGASHAAKVAPEASILVFLHADTYLPPAWDDSIFTLLSGPSETPRLGCFTLSLPSPITTGLRIMLWFANKRATWGHLPYGDQCYFQTRADFETLGRFPEVPIMEDVGLLQRVSRHGGSVEVLDAKVETSKRRWEKKGVFWNTVLNQLLITAWLCGTPPETIYRWYYGPRPSSKVQK